MMEMTRTKSKKKDWGLVAVGVLLAICGVVFIAMPGITLVTLTILAGAIFLISGIFNIISFVRFREAMNLSGWLIAYAIFDILIGALFLISPLVFANVIPWVIGVFFVVFGIFEIIGSFRIKNLGGPLWGWMLFSGIVSILCGILFFIVPVSVIIFIGIFVIMRGVSLVVYGATTDKVL